MADHHTKEVTFYLNGEKRVISSPSPDLMLIDWLRSPEVGLTGPKKPCGQGGCGGCTVVLSHWDEEEGKPVHLPINSCLRPVAALNGLAVTTIEGTGSVRECMNKVAYRVAKNNGTQCGYCTNGWVMAMTGFLANEPDNRSKKDIEELFDGNLCRCTGYRALLDGMKTFASDWTAEDEAKLMKCYVDPAFAAAAVAEKVEIAFPEGARRPVKPVGYEHDGKRWIEAGSVDEAIALVRGNPRARLVNGNTSFGIYKDEVLEAEVYVDIGAIEDLRGIVLDKGELSIGAGVTYGELLAYLGPNGREGHGVLAMLDYMGRRTAGSLVRNAASLAGNTMLVLHHIHDGEPFPSDLATAFCAADALVDYVLISKGERRQSSLSALMSACAADPHLAGDLFLLRYRVSVERDGVFWAQKTALREVNSHSIVNSGSCITLETAGGQEPKIAFVNLVFGGIAPYAWRPERTISFLQGKKASPDVVAKALHCLTVEVKDELAAWAKRMASVPNEGFTDAYRLELAQSYLYKAVLNALLVVDPALVPEELRSAAVTHWQNWPVSGGSQSYQTSHYMEPLSEPYIKLMAMYQAQGEVKYTHETPVVAGTLFGAMIGAQRAVGTYRFIDPSSGKTVKPEALGEHLKERLGGFSRLVTAADIPEGGSNMAGDASDQPLFLEPGDAIMYAGQSLAMVLGTSERSAEAAADYVAEHCIAYDNHGDSEQPVLSIEDALAKDWIFPDCPQTASWMAHIWKVKRPGTKTDWVLPRTPGDMTVVVREKERDGVFYKVVATGQRVGSQLHFYMETQATVIQPRDDGSITVHSSTQSPKSVQDAVAKALGMPHNEIGVQVRQLGGGFGGKTGPSTFTACMAAIASRASNRPVHMALTRESDSGMIGRRHPYLGQYQLLVDTGATDPATKGLIHGLKGDLWGNGGAFYDCSFIVSDCIQLRVDNAYNIKYYETTIDVCRTNTAPNTAYRAFGDIQGTLILENAIEDAAVALDMDVTELREKNLYKEKDLTPGGQQLDYCYLRDVWKYAKEKSDFEARKRKVEDYNRANKWRKRGISLIPLKYGSGFNLVMLEQTTALLSIYESDGTIIIQQGGVDMGQGMITMLTQIAAYALNVPLSTVRVESSDTRVIPNPSSTGASTGTQYNGTAIKNACTEMKARMEAFVEGIRKIKGDDYCKSKNIDYWNYNNGWQAVPANNNGKTIWQNIVSMAFNERVNLQVQANAKITGGDHKVPNVEFRPYALQPTGTGIAIDSTASFSETVNTYIGFTYNAACAEVEVDILTGETKILRVDLIYDMGKSLNPAIDVGQIEGGFMQGVGYVLSENIVYEDKGESAGVMTTDNTWRYKPPAVSTVPIEMNVMLFPRELAKNVPEDPHLLYSSKEVGEPPLVLANTVFFAVKSAIRASRVERGLSPFFELPAPATVQAVRTAADVTALA